MIFQINIIRLLFLCLLMESKIRYKVIYSPIFPKYNGLYHHQTLLIEDIYNCQTILCDFVPNLTLTPSVIIKILRGRPIPGKIRYCYTNQISIDSNTNTCLKFINDDTNWNIKSESSEWDCSYYLYKHNCIDFKKYIIKQIQSSNES